MRKATRFHVVRGVAVAVLLLARSLVGLGIGHRVVEHQNQSHAHGLVQELLVADLAKVPGIVTDIEAYRAWADPLLREKHEQAAKGSSQKLHTSLALLSVDPRQRDYLYDRLLDAEPHEVEGAAAAPPR